MVINDVNHIVGRLRRNATAQSQFLFTAKQPRTERAYPTQNIAFAGGSTVELAAYLDTQGIVYRQSETQVIQARQNQWAQRLSPQLTQRITNDLRRKQSRYWPAPLNASSIQQEHWKLQVRLQRFNGVYTGNAEVAGNWELLNPKGESMLNQEFSFQVPLKDTGYPLWLKHSLRV